VSSGNGGDDSPITKGEFRNEMRSMVQEFLEMNMFGPREEVVSAERSLFGFGN